MMLDKQNIDASKFLQEVQGLDPLLDYLKKQGLNYEITQEQEPNKSDDIENPITKNIEAKEDILVPLPIVI